jgi:mannose-6-phosphate isomerase-like protein (cupin superfamily)
MKIEQAGNMAQYGKSFQMPKIAENWSDDEKKAWAVGLLSGYKGLDEVEVKHIVVDKSEKLYERLEIHDKSPQVYAVISGSVAVPVSEKLESESVRFYQAKAGEAIIVDEKVWHAGAVGIDTPAIVIVVLAAGTSESDTIKKPLQPAVKFG